MSRPSCHLVAMNDDQGGIAVTVVVPTYEGGAAFHLTVERDNDGDWRVFVPWPESISVDGGPDVDFAHESVMGEIDGMEVANGILYLGAPEADVSDEHDAHRDGSFVADSSTEGSRR